MLYRWDLEQFIIEMISFHSTPVSLTRDSTEWEDAIVFYKVVKADG